MSVDFDIADVTFEKDPPSVHTSQKATRGRPKKETTATPPLNPISQSEVATALNMLMMPVAMVAQMRDPYCGAVLAEQMPAITDAISEGIAQSPRMLKFFDEMTDKMWLGKLMIAIQPVAMVVISHHITGTLETVAMDDGDSLI